jgi:GNAT superfamily N-acetyltransferase
MRTRAAECVPHTVTVRDATPEDNASLLALDAACAMGRCRAWTIRHDPDFFALFRAAGVRAHVGAAYDVLGRVIGVMTLIEQPVAASGQGSTNWYVSGWQVHPQHRGRGVGDALVQWALRRCVTIDGTAGHAWFFTAGSGASLEHRVQRLAPWAAISSPIPLWSYCLPTRRRRAIPSPRGLAARPAVSEDVPEMAALWNAIACRRRLAPPLDAAAIERWRTGVLGMPPACYWVARTARGALVGFMALWDQRPVKQFHVERRLPWRRDRELPCLAATHVCVPPNDSEPARAVLSAASDAAARAGYSRIFVVADATDALSHACRERSGAGRAFTAFVVSGRGRADDAPDRRPVHVEAGVA